MRTSFVQFSLLVQLLCVLPALGEKYHIHSLRLKDYIVSTGEEMAGDLVATVPCDGKDDYPPHTIVDVSTPVDKETEGVICGKAGLYIGLHKDGNKLEWRKEPCAWKFTYGIDDGKPFYVVNLPGFDATWVDNVWDKCVVDIMDLMHAPTNPGEDACWAFDKADDAW